MSRVGFNSRTPGGVRRRRSVVSVSGRRFNSRTPGGVRLQDLGLQPVMSHVSIHAPREGCDSYLRKCLAFAKSFNSRTPGGVRLDISEVITTALTGFNSRTPGGVRPNPILKGCPRL